MLPYLGLGRKTDRISYYFRVVTLETTRRSVICLGGADRSALRDRSVSCLELAGKGTCLHPSHLSIGNRLPVTCSMTVAAKTKPTVVGRSI